MKQITNRWDIYRPLNHDPLTQKWLKSCIHQAIWRSHLEMIPLTFTNHHYHIYHHSSDWRRVVMIKFIRYYMLRRFFCDLDIFKSSFIKIFLWIKSSFIIEMVCLMIKDYNLPEAHFLIDSMLTFPFLQEPLPWWTFKRFKPPRGAPSLWTTMMVIGRISAQHGVNLGQWV